VTPPAHTAAPGAPESPEAAGPDMNAVVGARDVALITLDTLRYDVAVAALSEGRTPNLAAILPAGGWERRHAPGSFTYASHQAMFAGFLPTPARPGPHPRLFALRFPGSETTGPRTCVLDGPDIVSGLAARGYHTACVGGVGFFTGQNPLARVLPGLFAESRWSPAMGVTDPDSTAHQVAAAVDILARVPRAQRVFLFVNVSALHQPNCVYVPGADADSPATQAAALAYVDGQLPPLLSALRGRAPDGAPPFCIVCSDHGTAYGEDGYLGHRLAHPAVWDVPYAHMFL
jgi:hypothetical protein